MYVCHVRIKDMSICLAGLSINLSICEDADCISCSVVTHRRQLSVTGHVEAKRYRHQRQVAQRTADT